MKIPQVSCCIEARYFQAHNFIHHACNNHIKTIYKIKFSCQNNFFYVGHTKLMFYLSKPTNFIAVGKLSNTTRGEMAMEHCIFNLIRFDGKLGFESQFIRITISDWIVLQDNVHQETF